VLIVDDDALSRKMCRKSILSHCRTCDEAGDGQEGVSMCLLSMEGSDPYDLVMMDNYMPGMNNKV
jgi:CheY-like chemotaxis protein